MGEGAIIHSLTHNSRPNLEAQANITLFCNDQIKYRQLRLGGNEIDKSVEIRVRQIQMQMHLMRSHSFEVGQPFRSAGTEEWQCPPNGCLHQAQELWQARKMRNFITFLIKEFVGTRNWLPKAGAGPFGGRQPTIARKSHRLAITSC